MLKGALMHMAMVDTEVMWLYWALMLMGLLC